MGKAGKARKRQRLERELLDEASKKEQDGGDNEDFEGDEEERSERRREPARDAAEEGKEDEQVAIAVLDLLGRRLDLWSSKKMKALRTALFPLISGQHKRRAFFEPPDWPADCPPPDDAQAAVVLNPTAIAVLTRVAARIGRDPEAFTSSTYKPFRRALHPLVVEFSRKEGGKGGAPIVDSEHRSLSALISAAFRRKDWSEALALLTRMREECSGDGAGDEGKKPRLGALQRWVRDCDLAGAEEEKEGGEGGGGAGKNMSLLLLDAVLRVAALQSPSSPRPASSSAAPPTVAVVTRHPPFRPPQPPPPSTATSEPLADLDKSALGVHVVSHVPGPQRRPPSPNDLYIYGTAPGVILDSSAPSPPPAPPSAPPTATPARHDVPDVPGAFLMTDILSPSECRRIIAAAEAIGYSPDAVLGIDCVQWLADPSMLDPIYERCRPLLPASIAGCALRGINARWRMFRYTPGAVYRPHIDGAWPGSGFDADGKYTDDAYKGDRYSRLTFLVYLNGGFEGGGTTFYLPGEAGPGYIEARSVEPREGSVLCFPHGDAQGSLVHEGSGVGQGGVKYVIRSDVLYAVKPDE